MPLDTHMCLPAQTPPTLPRVNYMPKSADERAAHAHSFDYNSIVERPLSACVCVVKHFGFIFQVFFVLCSVPLCVCVLHLFVTLA